MIMDDSQSVTYTKKNVNHHFVFNFERMMDLEDEQFVTTPSFHALGRDWVIDCYPQNSRKEAFVGGGEYTFCSFLVRSEGIYEKLDAMIHCNFMKRDGKSFLLCLHERRCQSEYWENRIKKSYPFRSRAFAYGEYRHNLMEEFVDNGCFELIFIIRDRDKCIGGRIPTPFDLYSQIWNLFGSGENTDVTFNVKGRIFKCHRIILAARSPVFNAELFGSMAEAKRKCIKIAGISPEVFDAMLHFIYTDSLQGYNSQIPTTIIQQLFEAADRYAIEGLKALCEDKLCVSLSLDTVAATLVLAEHHSSPRLKNACLDFIAEQRTLVAWMLTDEYLDLVRDFPSLKEEIRAKVRSLPSFRSAKKQKLS